ncbi:type II secretion system protein [Cellvibrio sp. OA-2007]|uniref:type II secretion system protein n=1 Tax=Cellvibrio sp. OA-2007 TaxID=529823 RepID=UPI0007858F36|nr:type II secretion system protein [Cellvibrio sp. OA-2007]
MYNQTKGFSLIELITVMILVGIISISLFSRLGPVNTAAVQSGRDDLIAALFFAQQQAMMRSNISLVLTSNTISVKESGVAIKAGSDYYPLTVPVGVNLPALTLNYDKLGRTSKTPIVLTGSGNSSGVTATIQVEASGYAYAQ